MTGPPGCPDEPTVRAAMDGSLGELAFAALMEHLEGCDPCSRAYEQKAGLWGLDPFQDLNREPDGGPDTPHEESIQAIVDQISQGGRSNPGHSGAADVDWPEQVPEIPGLSDFEQVNRGGMGVVYRARDTSLDRVVAVKLLFSSGLGLPTVQRRAEREAKALARLTHPNVVQIYRWGEVEGLFYLVMEWVPGGSLQQKIDQAPLPPRQAATVVRDLARAVAKAHAMGIIHRDVKPDNILLAPTPADEKTRLFIPKLADFGLARPENANARLTQQGILAGTPEYMAPEQTGLNPAVGQVGPATDIHGLGAVLYASLSGHAPFESSSARNSLNLAAQGAAPPLRSRVSGVPADLRTILEKCLQVLPQNRYRSAGELADDLDRFLEGRPIQARSVGPIERLSKWARRRPISALASLFIVAGLLAGAAGAVFYLIRMEQANTKISQSLDEARTARDTAQKTLARLTDTAVERLIQRGSALNAEDQAFLRMVRDQYLEWPLTPDPRAALLFRLAGLKRVATLLAQIDQYEAAYDCQQSILGTLDELDSRKLAGPTQVDDRLEALKACRMLLYRQGKIPEAEAIIHRIVAVLENVAPHRPRYQAELAAYRVELGREFIEQKRPDESTRMVQNGLDLLDQLGEQQPDDVEIRKFQTGALFNASYCSQQCGRPAERQARLRRQIHLSDTLIAQFPGEHAYFTTGLMNGLGTLTDALLEQGSPEQALPYLERFLTLVHEHRNSDPENPHLNAEAISASITCYRVHDALGNPGNAASELANAVTLASKSAAAEPAVFERAWLLAIVLKHQVELWEKTGQSQAAMAGHRRIMETLTPWAGLGGHSAMVIEQILGARRGLARLQAKAGDHRAAAGELEQALALAPADQKPGLFLLLAREQQAAGQIDAARASAEEALKDSNSHDQAQNFLEALGR